MNDNTKRVPLHKLPGERLPGCGWVVDDISYAIDGWYCDPSDGSGPSVALSIDADGMVTVLRDIDAATDARTAAQWLQESVAQWHDEASDENAHIVAMRASQWVEVLRDGES